MVVAGPKSPRTKHTFRKAARCIGISCSILLFHQFISNLTVVYQDQSGLVVEDAPAYPDPKQYRARPTVTRWTAATNSTTALSLPQLSVVEVKVNESAAQETQNNNILSTESLEHQEQQQRQIPIHEADGNGSNSTLSLESSLWSIETSHLYVLPQYGQIRRWGCRLSTVPFIFVHIGKTGGGNIRARLAASSLNYTKKEFRHQDFSYYPLKKQHRPVQHQSKQRLGFKYDDEDRAQFCHTGFHMFKPQAQRKLFRRSLQCNATTPLGQALACPEIFHHAYDPNRTRIIDQYQPQNIQSMIQAIESGNADNETIIFYHNRNALRYRRHPCFLPPSSDHAHIVFAGHHNFGSEMHWLPAGMLLDWWNTVWAHLDDKEPTITVSESSNTTAVKQQHNELPSKAFDRVTQRIQALYVNYDISTFPHHYGDGGNHHDHEGWCQGQPRPLFAYEDTAAFHQSCSEELYEPMDELVKEAVRLRMSHVSTSTSLSTAVIAATNTTATTPVLNEKLVMAGYWSTLYASLPVLRVTILRDPFSWLCSKFFWHRVDDLFNATCDDAAIAIHGDWLSIQNKKQPQGWARRMALLYLEQICGDDCVVRSFYSKESILDELELQATANLRQGFAVVGILPDLDDFYDLLNRRMYYLNTSLNPHVEGLRHGSFSADPDETVRCKNQFLKNQTFRDLMLQAPEIAALQRVYEVGVEVNRFQRKELDQC